MAGRPKLQRGLAN
ncbi:putative Cbp-p300-interacting transactivator 3 protein, partial [Naja naja]